jgi:predicted transglutaminase-like cysteine proteinase
MLGRLIAASTAIALMGSMTPPPSLSTSQGIANPPSIVGIVRTADQDKSIRDYGVQAIAEQCRAQPGALWCRPGVWASRTLTSLQILSTNLTARDRFIYTSDVKDNWRVSSARVLLDQRWTGDCDDLASTTLDMLIRAGQPLNKAWLVLVDVDHKNLLDHLVAMVEDDSGQHWIVGDTMHGLPIPVAEVKFSVVALARADTMREWRGPRSLGVFSGDALRGAGLLD